MAGSSPAMTTASILLRFGGEDFVDVAASVENPHNLGHIVAYSVEDDMRDRSAQSEVLARAKQI
jgi:hypothetical protein